MRPAKPISRPAQVLGMNVLALGCIRSEGVEKQIVGGVDYGSYR